MKEVKVMNRRSRFISFVLVSVLTLSLLLIAGCGKKEEGKKEPTPPVVAGNIVERERADISKVQISTGEITYTLNNNVGFEIEGFESELLLNVDLATSLIPAVEEIPYTGKIEKISSLSDYGLEKEEKSVTVFYGDGSQFKLLIGKEASEYEYYAMVENGDCVYKIPAETYESLMKHPGEYRDKYVCSMDDTTVEAFTIYRNGKKDVTVKKDRNFVPTNEYQTTSYIVTYPYNNKNAALGVLWYMFENIPDEVVADSVVEETPSDLSIYGLSPAALTLELTDAQDTNTLRFGNEKDGKVYLMCNDSSVVYLVESPLYDIIKEFKASNYVEGYIGLHNIVTVSSISISKGDETHTMAIEEAEGYTNYLIDGIVMKEKDFKGIYQSVIAVSAKDFVEETPDGEVYAEITYKFKDETSISYKYYDYNENYCLAKAMNGLTALVAKADIDNLVEIFTKEN